MEAGSTLRFEPNVPVDVGLKYTGGLPVTSQATGKPQMMYTLVDGRRMYLDLDVAARVDALKVKSLTICKVGKGKDAQWAVGAEEVGAARQAPGASFKQPAPLEFPPKPEESAEHVRSRKLVAAADNSMRCYLKAAVSAAAETENYAQSIGRKLEFSSGDILTAAIFLAQMMQGGS